MNLSMQVSNQKEWKGDSLVEGFKGGVAERGHGEGLEVQELGGGRELLWEDEVAEGNGQHRLALQPPLTEWGQLCSLKEGNTQAHLSETTRMKYWGGTGSATGTVKVTVCSSSTKDFLRTQLWW